MTRITQLFMPNLFCAGAGMLLSALVVMPVAAEPAVKVADKPAVATENASTPLVAETNGKTASVPVTAPNNAVSQAVEATTEVEAEEKPVIGSEDGVALAGTHCQMLMEAANSAQPLVAADGLDMRFALGGASVHATPKQQAEFNAQFARHLVEKYQLGGDGKVCGMHVVDVAKLKEQGVGLKYSGRPGLPKVADDAALYVATSLPTKTKDLPVQVTYTLRGGPGQWQIEDMSINGKPVSDNYQPRLRAYVDKYGFAALLAKLGEVL